LLVETDKEVGAWLEKLAGENSTFGYARTCDIITMYIEIAIPFL